MEKGGRGPLSRQPVTVPKQDAGHLHIIISQPHFNSPEQSRAPKQPFWGSNLSWVTPSSGSKLRHEARFQIRHREWTISAKQSCWKHLQICSLQEVWEEQDIQMKHGGSRCISSESHPQDSALSVPLSNTTVPRAL